MTRESKRERIELVVSEGKEKGEQWIDLVAYEGKVNGKHQLSNWDNKLNVVKAHKICAAECIEIREVFSSMEYGRSAASLTSIDSHTLKEVVKFCYDRAAIKGTIKNLHTDPRLVQLILEKFDSDFVRNKSVPEVTKYLRAACQLKIKSLLDLTSTTLVNKMVICGIDNRRLLKMFHMKKTMTVEEMKEQIEENSWAFM